MHRLVKMLKTVLIVCLSLSAVLAKNEIYEGYTLFEVSVKDPVQAKAVSDFENFPGIDVWSDAIPGRDGQVLVAPDQKQTFLKALDDAKVEYTVAVENIKEAIELEEKLLSTAASRSNRSTFGLDFNTIHRYEVVDAFLVDLARRYPDVVTLESAGRSFEGRDIKYLKISTTNFQDHSKPIVMMESLLHCREWVGLPASLYAIQKLVIDVTERDVVENIDWIIIPIANPDGYEFTHDSSRFWRKNRATGFMVGNACMGVDLNRNFGIHWGTASSNSVCTEIFHGRGPFSEPESIAVRNVMLQHQDRLELFIDIHSFGSLILYGYGNGVLPPNGLIVHLNGVLMAQAIDANKWPSNPNYIVGNVQAVLYAASGSAQDYAQSIGASYSYTYELPAYSNLGGTVLGFLVDPDFIEQAGFETWEGIKAGARYAANNFRNRVAVRR